MFAQTGGPAPELVGWAQLGVMGLVILAFMTTRVVTAAIHDRALRQLDDCATKIAEQDRWMRDTVVPSLVRNTDVLQQVLEILRDDRRRN